MGKKDSQTGFEKLLEHTGPRYPIIILLLVQAVNTPLMLLLAAMPAQTNAQFSREVGFSLLIFSVVAIIIRNIILLIRMYFGNQAVFKRLRQIQDPKENEDGTEWVDASWHQVNTLAKKYVLYELVSALVLVLLPTVLFGVLRFNIELRQVIHIGLAFLAALIITLIMEILTLDQMFMPLVRRILPKEFHQQLAGLNGLRFRAKLSIGILGLIFVALLLTIPSAYHQINRISSLESFAPEQTTVALLVIINSGIGAIFMGVLLSYRLISYFSSPIKKLVDLFEKVEKGDLGQRMDVSHTDEYGEVAIHLNRMISRLQQITVNLEQQVDERTKQLQTANKQLSIELKERKRVQEQLAYSVLHDSLTDIPNRNLLLDRLERVVTRAKRHGTYNYAVFFMDLDRFKVVNDSLGHDVGDLLLIESAKRLQECVREQDTVARLGGDEFVVLLEDLTGPQEYEKIAERIIRLLAKPAEFSTYRVFVSVSIGVVLGHKRYANPEEILRDADIAMYHAKNNGRSRYDLFNPGMLEAAQSRLELENDLRAALDKKEFILHYQPIYAAQSKKMVGMEALIRWQHPVRGLLMPAEFIRIAEETGMIIPMGYWVLEEVCRQLKDWNSRYPEQAALSINVNLSTKQCADLDLIDILEHLFNKYQIDPESISLGMTESLIIEDTQSIRKMLEKLRELGVSVQIDDFGTGYSALGYLHALAIDVLKIDRSFVNLIQSDGTGSEIVQTISALAHNLGMHVIAEGVETEEQLSILQSLGCEYVQGYLLAHAVESEQIEEMFIKSK